MSAPSLMPLVGVVTNTHFFDAGQAYSVTSHRALRPCYDTSGVLPVLIPALDINFDVTSFLEKIDGLYLTGGISNVHAQHYGGTVAHDETLLDTARDEVALILLRHARARRMPVFAICRGMQEINVAYGGTLKNLCDEPVNHGHGGGGGDIVERLENKAHALSIQPGGLFSQWFGQTRLAVNSLHGQGICNLAEGLRAEAVAPDGVVEAISDPQHPFMLGVQWHPEWRAAENPVGKKLYEEFGNAVRTYASQRAA